LNIGNKTKKEMKTESFSYSQECSTEHLMKMRDSSAIHFDLKSKKPDDMKLSDSLKTL
jgi:hypothetical protein